MKDQSFNVVLIVIITIVLPAVNGCSSKGNTVPRYLIKYANEDVTDKPDLLVGLKSRSGYNEINTEVDFFGKDGFKKKYTINSDVYLFKNKLEYDAQNNNFYIVTEKLNLFINDTFSPEAVQKIQKISLDDQKSNENLDLSIKSIRESETIESIALDWVTSNLYIATDEALRIVNFKNISKSSSFLCDLQKNSIVTVFPNLGYLVLRTSDHAVTRFNQDGTNPLVLKDVEEDFIKNLALDHYNQAVYWIEYHSGVDRICYVSVNGGEVRTFDIIGFPYNVDIYEYIDVDEKYVYFIPRQLRNDEHNNHLLRARKVDGAFDIDFDVVKNSIPDDPNGELLTDIWILNVQRREVTKEHPCQNENGGCEGFCVAIPDGNGKLAKKCIEAGLNKTESESSWWGR